MYVVNPKESLKPLILIYQMRTNKEKACRQATKRLENFSLNPAHK